MIAFFESIIHAYPGWATCGGVFFGIMILHTFGECRQRHSSQREVLLEDKIFGNIFTTLDRLFMAKDGSKEQFRSNMVKGIYIMPDGNEFHWRVWWDYRPHQRHPQDKGVLMVCCPTNPQLCLRVRKTGIRSVRSRGWNIMDIHIVQQPNQQHNEAIPQSQLVETNIAEPINQLRVVQPPAA